MEGIKEALKEKGISQKELAELMSVKPPVISYWIKGTREPTKEQALKLKELLGIKQVRTMASLSVKNAAMFLGCSKELVEDGLRAGVFSWGYAIKGRHGNQYRYIINADRFAEHEMVFIPEEFKEYKTINVRKE